MLGPTIKVSTLSALILCLKCIELFVYELHHGHVQSRPRLFIADSAYSLSFHFFRPAVNVPLVHPAFELVTYSFSASFIIFLTFSEQNFGLKFVVQLYSYLVLSDEQLCYTRYSIVTMENFIKDNSIKVCVRLHVIYASYSLRIIDVSIDL
jgi:hypothetical protein